MDMDDKVLMVFFTKLSKIMIAAEPSLYQKYVTYRNGEAILYVQLQKVLHGFLKSALLF